MFPRNEKLIALRSLKSEVKQFHVLLRDLLCKLDHVRNVEYTHGTSEKGADFVIEKQDPTLLETNHVGVIVKIGKIHMDFSDVERQIRECEQPRNFRNGKKKIRLNEVWVITNDSITENAKDKINTFYPTKNVHFVDAERLVDWIDIHMEYYWHRLPTPLGDYLSNLLIKTEAIDKQSSLVPAEKGGFYIPLDLVRVDTTSYEDDKKPRLVNLEAELWKRDVLLLEGEMGFGKSKLLRELIKAVAAPAYYAKNQLLPISISYRAFMKDYGGDLQTLLNKVTHAFRHVLSDRSTYLIMIDGIDEALISETAGDTALRNLIDEVRSAPNTKLILATRPLKFLESDPAVYRRVSRYRLQPLTLKKITKFIENVCSTLDIPKRLFDDIRKSDLFKQLPQSPIAAMLLSRLLSDNSKELPSTITELYSRSLELMLGKWDIEKGLVSLREYDAIDRICCELSEYMLDNSIDRIAESEILARTESYLRARNLDLDSAALFERITNRSGLLGFDPGSRTFSFKHRSFAEFLYAKHKFKEHSLEIDRRAFDLYWQDIFFFYVGLHKDCPILIQELLAYPANAEGERWLKVLNMPQYFMAGFLSPYDLVEDNLYKLFMEAADLYEKALGGNTETKLNEVPELRALWLVQFLIRNAYSYEYFGRAMEATAVRIADTIAEKNIKAYALFFMGVVCVDLGEEEPFRFLLNSFKTEQLPLGLSAALEVEMRSKKELGRSASLKRHSKKLNKAIKGNRSFRDSFKKLFSKPSRADELTHGGGGGTENRRKKG